MTRASIYGLLGRNGSGKTTTIKMLLGITRADSGPARVFGLDALFARPLRQARGGRGRR